MSKLDRTPEIVPGAKTGTLIVRRATRRGRGLEWLTNDRTWTHTDMKSIAEFKSKSGASRALNTKRHRDLQAYKKAWSSRRNGRPVKMTKGRATAAGLVEGLADGLGKTIKPKITELIQFIRRHRRGNNVRIGVLVAQKRGQVVSVGHSLCHSRLDKYDENLGLEIARTRISDGTHRTPSPHLRFIPNSIMDEAQAMGERAKRFFRVKQINFV